MRLLFVKIVELSFQPREHLKGYEPNYWTDQLFGHFFQTKTIYFSILLILFCSTVFYSILLVSYRMNNFVTLKFSLLS
jgi:hypothetical protein